MTLILWIVCICSALYAVFMFLTNTALGRVQRDYRTLWSQNPDSSENFQKYKAEMEKIQGKSMSNDEALDALGETISQMRKPMHAHTTFALGVALTTFILALML